MNARQRSDGADELSDGAGMMPAVYQRIFGRNAERLLYQADGMRSCQSDGFSFV
ncbi:hypothetical protein ECP02989423_3454 [Escherichia coli P0298942.3]|nr:hypothetical protein ECP02989423_3454 [Escherichia coli P0298942.3]